MPKLWFLIISYGKCSKSRCLLFFLLSLPPHPFLSLCFSLSLSLWSVWLHLLGISSHQLVWSTKPNRLPWDSSQGAQGIHFFLQLFFNSIFYFEISVATHAVVRNNAERSPVPLPSFFSGYSLQIVQHNFTIMILSLIESGYRTFPSPQGALVFPFHSQTYFLPGPLISSWQPLICPFLSLWHFKAVV